MIEQLLKKLENEKIAVLHKDELDKILEKTKVLKEAETNFYGKIRILALSSIILIQEMSDKSELIIRRASSKDEADNFVRERLSTYERMWDGCGCKVKYYE